MENILECSGSESGGGDKIVTCNRSNKKLENWNEPTNNIEERANRGKIKDETEKTARQCSAGPNTG